VSPPHGPKGDTHGNNWGTKQDKHGKLYVCELWDGDIVVLLLFYEVFNLLEADKKVWWLGITALWPQRGYEWQHAGTKQGKH